MYMYLNGTFLKLVLLKIGGFFVNLQVSILLFDNVTVLNLYYFVVVWSGALFTKTNILI